MRFSALASVRIPVLAAAVAACLALNPAASYAQADPPSQGGRISAITGVVSIQPAGTDDWGAAVPNLPIGPGDRIVTDDESRVEIQVGQTFLRVGPNSDVSFVDASPAGLYFGLAQGSIHLHTFGLWPGQKVYVHTPNGASTIARPGETRVDVLLGEQAAIFTDIDTNTLVTGAGGFIQTIGTGQAMELIGSNPVMPQWLEPAGPDSLDLWSQQRDQQITQSASFQYVSQEIPGAFELDAAGSWMPGTPYGAVWFPNVGPGWAPYHNGHWINHAPWGWVWVEDESWGYAPFHYGRWVVIGGRWGWVPGPPSAHPVWSPALVVFAGGSPGVSAWFPLGPGEPYRPWYPCSPRYIDVVNISNITVTNVVHVQTTYVNFNFDTVVFANRAHGYTAIRNEDFASGRSASQVTVNVDVHIFDHVQVLKAPEPRPTAQSFVGHAPARPVRVPSARPVLINENGMAVAAKPGAAPSAPPVKAAPTVRPLPGRKTVAPPPSARTQPVKTESAPAPRQEEKAATPAKPAEKPAPADKQAPVVKPGTAEHPAANPPKPADKPGDKPGAANDKNKKNDKDKEKKDQPQ